MNSLTEATIICCYNLKTCFVFVVQTVHVAVHVAVIDKGMTKNKVEMCLEYVSDQ